MILLAMSRQHNNSTGFTIIELMIATAVFAVILLIVTGAIIGIGRLYTKGTITARTQDVARSVANSIAQTIQLTPGQVPPAPKQVGSALSYCIANQQYSYQYGQQVTNGQHGLLYKASSGCSSDTNPDMTSGTELLGDKMRLANLRVDQDPNNPQLYSIKVRVVYGDDDLLCSDSIDGSCSPNASPLLTNQINGARDLRCRNGGAGNEFCAMSELSTMVERRMQE